MTDDRPPRLVPTAIAAVKAAKNIPWGVKAVFVEDWILDRGPEGAWASATVIAARIGMSKDNVEKHRRRLRELGFYHVVRRDGAKSDGWVPMLPLGCRHHGTTIEDVANTAMRIDAYLTGQVRSISGALGTATSGARRGASGGVADGATRGAAQYATDGVPRAGGGGKEGGALVHDSPSKTLAPLEDREQESVSTPELQQEEPHREPTRAERVAMAEADAREAEEERRKGWAKIREVLGQRKTGT